MSPVSIVKVMNLSSENTQKEWRLLETVDDDVRM